MKINEQGDLVSVTYSPSDERYKFECRKATAAELKAAYADRGMVVVPKRRLKEAVVTLAMQSVAMQSDRGRVMARPNPKTVFEVSEVLNDMLKEAE